MKLLMMVPVSSHTSTVPLEVLALFLLMLLPKQKNCNFWVESSLVASSISDFMQDSLLMQASSISMELCNDTTSDTLNYMH